MKSRLEALEQYRGVAMHSGNSRRVKFSFGVEDPRLKKIPVKAESFHGRLRVDSKEFRFYYGIPGGSEVTISNGWALAKAFLGTPRTRMSRQERIDAGAYILGE